MGARDWNIDQPEESYWFNTRTNAVEKGKQSIASHRLGPFRSAAEAEQALQIIADRAEKIRAEDDTDD